jgi:hypothetical protein
MPDFIPQAALDYIKSKSLKAGFSYKDVWHEEHATAFTVAKAMQLDVLSDLHNAVIKAVESGESFDTFRKNIAPILQQKGWWGKKEMTDPLTGKTAAAQLGSGRRLKTIYRVNMRSAYQKGQYERTMASDLHPYLMYRIGPSLNHRPEHAAWDGLILPKTDPWWDAHFPPNGWGCKCYTRAVSEARKKQYEENGVPVPPGANGTGGGTLNIKTEAPPVKHAAYFNERKGTVEKVPEGIDPAFNWNAGKGCTKAAEQKLHEAEKNYKTAAAQKPKKEYLTKKKLEADIAAIDAQMKTAKGKKAVAELKAKKAEAQKLLNTKFASAEKKTLVKQQAALQKELDAIKIKTYNGIWKTEVTTADWAEKSGSIQAKKEYFKYKLSEGVLADADKIKFEQFIKDLDEFDAEGKRYYAVLSELQKTEARLTALKKGSILNEGSGNAFTQARKNAALWAKTTKEADDVARGISGEAWKTAPQTERKAIYDYTTGSGGFNRPLRGYEGNWSNFKGIGKVGLNAEGRAEAIEHMTRIIDKSYYDIDIWLQRGIETPSGAARFLQIPESVLRNSTQEKLQELIGTNITDAGFVSCGSTKGKGFSGYIFNIYCPKGTKMMYAEPFSHYGNGQQLNWDGIAKQAGFGYEDETIIQRGTTFRIAKVEKKGGSAYFDIEVVSQINGGR